MPNLLFTLAFVALSVLSLAPLSTFVALTLRARRRNAAGRCAQCGGAPYAPATYAGPSLVQGRLCCAPCSDRLRRRTQAAVLVLGALTVVMTTGAVVSAFTDSTLTAPWRWLLPVLVFLELGGYLAGSVTWMRRANRRAAARLAIAAATEQPHEAEVGDAAEVTALAPGAAPVSRPLPGTRDPLRVR